MLYSRGGGGCGSGVEEAFHGLLFLYVQDLAPFQGVSLVGCRRFVEPVSPRLCIKTTLWSEGIVRANVKQPVFEMLIQTPTFLAAGYTKHQATR